jgi:phage-related protein
MEVEFWKTWSGRTPVYKFIEKQPPGSSARLLKDLEYFEKHGMRLITNPNKLKQLTGYNNLYELKTEFKKVSYRVIFCIKDGKAWLLEAFKKKEDHTKLKYINTALKRQKVLLAGKTFKERTASTI